MNEFEVVGIEGINVRLKGTVGDRHLYLVVDDSCLWEGDLDIQYYPFGNLAKPKVGDKFQLVFWSGPGPGGY